MSTGTQQDQHGNEPVGDTANAPDRKADLLPVGHGNSPAAWACVGVMALGFVIIGLGMVFGGLLPVIIGGIVVIVIGLVLGSVLKRAGYGVGGDKIKSHHA